MRSSLSFLAALAFTVKSAKWNYDLRGQNVSHWPELFAECGYSRQSPIDVPMDSGSSCKVPLELDWISDISHYAIRNNGHSLQAIPFVIDHGGGSDVSGLEVLHHTNDTQIRLKNKFFGTYSSNIHREYCFDSLHFHWGRNDREGSEHWINHKAYPLEVHLVHYSCDYHVAGDALRDYATGEADVKYDDDNVLAVIGVMFEIGDPNPVLTKILDDIIIDGIYENKAGTDSFPHFLELYYTEFDVKELLPESREMISYLGSLTTPPCYETVRWHLMKNIMTVSLEQMEKFRMLLESTDLNDSMAPNFRPPQPRNGREIWSCQEDVDMDLIAEDSDDGDTQSGQTTVIVEDTSQSHQWKHIAIGFIILFSLTTVTCLFVLCYLCKTFEKMKDATKSRPQYEKAESNTKISRASSRSDRDRGHSQLSQQRLSQHAVNEAN